MEKIEEKNNIYIMTILFLVIISFTTIGITNYNNYYENKTIKEIKKNAVIIKDGQVKKENEGKLVLVSGKLNYNDKFVYDDLFYVTSFSPKFLRYVEMYQWYEYKTTDKNGKTIYKYGKKWSNELIDSTNFKDKKHKNPKYKVAGTLFRYSKEIKVGDYILSQKQKEKLPCKTRIKLSSNIPVYDSYRIYDNYIINSKDPENPEVGDNRVSYYYNDWEEITILAKQKNNSFDDYITNNNSKINIIIKNKQSIKKLIKFIIKKNIR